MRNRAKIVAVACGLFLAIGCTAAVAIPVPNPDPCDAKYASNTIANLKAYDDCRLDRIEQGIPGNQTVTVTPAPVTVTAPPVTVTVTAPASESPTPTPTQPTSTSATTSSASPTSSSTTSAPPNQPAVLDLPRVPWDGGPAYWSQFPNAKRAGWDKDTFLPILVWYGSCSPEQYTFDKSIGINTYAQCNPDTTYTGVKAANVFTLFPTQGQPSDGTQTQQVGTLLDDEVDGRYSTADGLAQMRKLADQYGVAKTGGFTYSNWTSGIVTYDRSMQFSADYYNTVDVNSIDAYLLSVPQCDWMNGSTWVGSRFRTPAVSSLSSGQAGTAVTQANCRSASSYGKLIDLEHEINAARGKQAPIWGVPEVLSTGGSVGGYKQPSPAQVKAAAFNSVIHEARGLMWFSQAPDQTNINDCISGDAFRDARLNPSACSAKNVPAVGEVNRLLTSLAPVINTQSYVWNFGAGVDSMLKVKDGAAYVFAMPKDAGAGDRTFTLPGGITGSTVEVVGESRSIPVSAGQFTDNFADASTYHVYRITL